MWFLYSIDEYEKDLRWHGKKRRNQLVPTLVNLERFADHLNTKGYVKPLAFGFLRDEGNDILRISEAGARSNVAATRIYVYPCKTRKILFLLCIGDKNTQGEDIQFCRSCVDDIVGNPQFGVRSDDGKPAEAGEKSESDEGRQGP